MNTPVVLIIFNRPEHTQLVFSEIAKSRPPCLLIIADGPRPSRPGEEARCRAARKIAEAVDWDCEVLTNYAATNMGCRKRIISGLNWAFKQVDQAIILEDDCVPDSSFFSYCEPLLTHYKDEEKVMMISGQCFLPETTHLDTSYYFSKETLIWGWATWARAWCNFDRHMEAWPRLRDSSWLENTLPTPGQAKQWRRVLDDTYAGKTNAWSRQWSYSIWKNDGLTIIPATNLISNIGFGEEGTHTTKVTPLANLATRSISFPLIHPERIEWNRDLDRSSFKARKKLMGRKGAKRYWHRGIGAQIISTVRAWLRGAKKQTCRAR